MNSLRPFNFLFTTLLCISWSCLNAQVDYKPGYYIDNDGNKISCLIRDKGWKKNPETITIKIGQNGESINLDKTEIVKFHVGDQLYQKFYVDIDHANNQIGNLGYKSSPAYIRDTILLRYIIEGSISLLEYRDGNFAVYYYQKENEDLKHLLFKKYKSKTGKILYNNTYKSQLWKELKCHSIEYTDIEKLKYDEKNLTRYFLRYYDCSKENFSLIRDSNNKKTKIKFNAGIGIRYANLNFKNSALGFQDSESTTGYSFNLEQEFIPPFYNGTWTFILGQGIQRLSLGNNVRSINKLDYTAIEVYAGIRHNIYVKKSRLFLNALYLANFQINSSLELTTPSQLIDLSSSQSWAIGGGYNRNNISVEFRYSHYKNLSGDYVFWNITLQEISLLLKYRLF